MRWQTVLTSIEWEIIGLRASRFSTFTITSALMLIAKVKASMLCKLLVGKHFQFVNTLPG